MCSDDGEAAVTKRYNLDLTEEEIELVKNCRKDREWEAIAFINKLKIALLTQCESWQAEDK